LRINGSPWGFAWIGFIPFLSRSEFHVAPFLAVVSATYLAAVFVTARIRHAEPKVAPGIVAVVVLFLFLTPLAHLVDRATPSAETDLFLPTRPKYTTSPHYKGIGGWERVPSGTTSILNGVSVVDTNNAWTVGGDGTVLHWDGVGWNAIEISGLSDAHLWDVWASDDGEVWVVGSLSPSGSCGGPNCAVLNIMSRGAPRRQGLYFYYSLTAEGKPAWTISRNPDGSVASLSNGTTDVAVNRAGDGSVSGTTVTEP
jgi:hypothetical protein